jgi:hypothetical protein
MKYGHAVYRVVKFFKMSVIFFFGGGGGARLLKASLLICDGVYYDAHAPTFRTPLLTPPN